MEVFYLLTSFTICPNLKKERLLNALRKEETVDSKSTRLFADETISVGKMAVRVYLLPDASTAVCFLTEQGEGRIRFKQEEVEDYCKHNRHRLFDGNTGTIFEIEGRKFINVFFTRESPVIQLFSFEEASVFLCRKLWLVVPFGAYDPERKSIVRPSPQSV